MSLQVWLPLNGNLNNQGLKDVIVNVSGTTTFSSEGKIGQCLSCNGSTFWTIPSFSIGAEVSICCWIKTSTNGKMPWVLESDANNKLNLYMSSIYTLNTGDGNNNPFQDDSNNSISVLTDGKWHHHVVTFGNSIAKLYIDGIYHGKAKTFRNPTTTNKNFRIAGGYNNGTHTYDFNGLINDIRIYDHCLSAKEVEEISKGLILHYKLDDIKTSIWSLNYYKRTATLTTSNTYIYSLPSKTIYLTPGKQYTVGAQVRVNQDNIKFNFDTNCTDENGVYSGNDAAQTVQYNPTITLEKDTWTQVWVTTTIKSDAGKPYYHHGFLFRTISGELTTLCEIQNIEVYEGSAQIFTTYDKTNTVYDSSGYGNHGTSISSPVPSNNTIRYKNSLLFDGTDDAIQFPYNQINPSGIFTVNLWFYKSELGSKNYETLFGGPSGFEMDTRSGSSTTLSLYMASVRGGNVFSPFALNTWYMITMVRDGINELYYVNGNLVKTIEAKSMPTGTYYIGAWNVSTSQNYKGNISDFRLYATVLTEEQIKELYNTSATIDNNGNIYSRGFIENDNLNITKTGLFQTSTIEDDNNGQASIFKTKKILGTNLYEY